MYTYTLLIQSLCVISQGTCLHGWHWSITLGSWQLISYGLHAARMTSPGMDEGPLFHGAVRAAPHHHLPVDFSEMSVPPPALMGSSGLHFRTEGTDVLWLVPLGSIRVPYLFSHSRGGRQLGVSLGKTLLKSCSLSLLKGVLNNCLLQRSSKLWP